MTEKLDWRLEVADEKWLDATLDCGGCLTPAYRKAGRDFALQKMKDEREMGKEPQQGDILRRLLDFMDGFEVGLRDGFKEGEAFGYRAGFANGMREAKEKPSDRTKVRKGKGKSIVETLLG